MEDVTLLYILTLAWSGILLAIAVLNFSKLLKAVVYLGMWLLVMLPFAMFVLWRFDQQWN